MDIPTPILTTCGREIGPQDIEHAQAVARLCSGLSRHKLALTLCEHWGWISATGSYQIRSCVKLLDKLERQGVIRLPQKRRYQRRRTGDRGKTPAATSRTAPQRAIACELAALRPVWLEPVSGNEATALWNEYVDRYHSLGFKQPFGCTLRYFVTSQRGPLGCILLAGAARALGVRDKWIGWSQKQRLRNLPWAVNNSRLLLFPWVTVLHLASHVLGQLARRLQDDWEERWGYRPVLLETFVDPAHHRGVSYRAAGWLVLGRTTGEGLRRPNHQYTTTPKLIFVRPLVRDFRARLCSSDPSRRPNP